MKMQERTAQPLGHQPPVVAADDFLARAVDVPDVVGIVGLAFHAHFC
jgi:hypothetical protein